MKLRTKLAYSALIVCGTMAATIPEAFAWSCQATADDGTYGYSYNFDNEGAATQRALDECATRATTDQTCEITECDPDL